ncbi:ERAD-associated E3 ubiquitin-protein ligase HRD1-like [Stegodyphus dumicola]|uniref:ERAD-associated E3 ubiquitin-protein ligase HRD1-like n=1 Tax=Stegodyphus dumicola TaxID=202533 RepID=UPI0015B028AB|nr:ERAD-associated E3 ubiquitin-protein ligase HRD1-like [Stegodyphus dumicola]
MNRERRNRAETLQRSEAMSSLINQIMFFMLCDRWFCPEEKLTGLYALLFYNVICYLLMYTQRLVYLQDITPVVFVSEHSNVRHLAMTATKVMLEFTRAVTFVVTGVFMLLVFGLEQGLEHFNPTWYYIGITAIYFTLTERTCQEKIPSLLTYFHCDMFESLENLWTPVLVRLCSSVASGLMILLVFICTHENWALLLAASFINVYMTIKDLDHHWQALMKEKLSIEKYRYASLQELNENDDVCAVCLQAMSCARITPCHHMFHAECLRRCLKERPTCPMCKYFLE